MSTCSWENEKVIIFLLRTVHGSLSRASRTDKQGRLREVELWIHMRLMCRLNMWEWCSLVVWWGMLRNTMKVFQSDCYTRECIERASYKTSVIFFPEFCLERFKLNYLSSNESNLRMYRMMSNTSSFSKRREHIILNLHNNLLSDDNCSYCWFKCTLNLSLAFEWILFVVYEYYFCPGLISL